MKAPFHFFAKSENRYPVHLAGFASTADVSCTRAIKNTLQITSIKDIPAGPQLTLRTILCRHGCHTIMTSVYAGR
jgi:hypothetical protein